MKHFLFDSISYYEYEIILHLFFFIFPSEDTLLKKNGKKCLNAIEQVLLNLYKHSDKLSDVTCVRITALKFLIIASTLFSGIFQIETLKPVAIKTLN